MPKEIVTKPAKVDVFVVVRFPLLGNSEREEGSENKAAELVSKRREFVSVLENKALRSVYRDNEVKFPRGLDRAAFEDAAKAMGWSDFAWADWTFDVEQANYYGIAKSGALAAKASAIDAALKAMVSDGRVKNIYAKYRLDPEHIE